MRVTVALFLVCALAACNRPAAEATAPASTATGTTAAAPEAPAVDTANCAFCADPAVVRTCDVAGGVPTTLYWRIADPAVTSVGIFVVDDAGKDAPFAEQPPSGSLKTGPWLKPGLTFKLKDPQGKVLHSIVIEGRDC